MRYTPGPWNIKPNGDLYSVPRGAAPQQIGSITWLGNAEDRAGNVRLLQASAQLLETLGEVLMLVDYPAVVQAIQKVPGLLPKAQVIVDGANAAITAATGQKRGPWPKSSAKPDILLKS